MENRERVFSIPFGGPVQDCPLSFHSSLPIKWYFCSRIHPLRYW
ncbi:unnamed protein product [Musa acuminata subsp. burmannicoides]